MKLTRRKFYAGMYEIVGRACQCGGTLLANRTSSTGMLRWEMYCEECLAADNNGYSTLAECVEAAAKWKP